jgi:membrane protein YdbS with pleckstrin-like domain
MTDPYPQSFPIEIEHEKLCRYLRAEAFLGWGTVLVFLASLIGLMSRIGKENQAHINSVGGFWRELFFGLGVGAGSGLLLALLLYVPLHFSMKKAANALHVFVEGQYLRVVQGWLFRRDRKLHFRAIVDYSCFQGPLMRRCGITGITMYTTAGGQGSVVKIQAVKDAAKIRDMLSDIDRLREHLESA